MPKPLVVVESPAKAKTIAAILGRDYIVESSVGHIRDLPPSASEIPAAYKEEPWARLGVDVENDFKPLYVVPKDKKQHVKRLKGRLKDAGVLYLATDEDREGESIAWHLQEVLSPRIPVQRMVFHEITRSAIQRAIENPRDLDRCLVDAQEARRLLDRLFGYEVSPVLWKKVLPNLSAGRVQSVAVRLIVERELARMDFASAAYWDIEGSFSKEGDESTFTARLLSVGGQRIASSGSDFDERGNLEDGSLLVLDRTDASALAARLAGTAFTVRTVDERPYKSSPRAPFITSTLQQEAGRKLGFTARRTMAAAQRLYENGYITYMRTDSTTLSSEALNAARSVAARLYGADHVASSARQYAKKVKNAQEAHEAIRPAGETSRLPDDVRREVSGDEARLYELIWMRTVASQMADARGRSVRATLGATSSEGENVVFELSPAGKVIDFYGYMRAYVEGADDPEAALEDREVLLPPLAAGDALTTRSLAEREHETRPPARFTEASLVKELEDRAIGRPSTYASIIETIQQRGYVFKKGSALVPSFTAFAVVKLLRHHFPRLVDYDFTAKMEDDLDAIANGEMEQVPWLRQFYFGNGQVGLHDLVSRNLDDIDPREVNSIPLGNDGNGEEIVVRVGRYGPYLQRGDDTASIPQDLPPDELTVARALELLEAPDDHVLGTDPESGKPVLLKSGRFGPYVQLGEIDEGSNEKPRTASLFRSMDPKTLSLDAALKLLSLPRVVGEDPQGNEILALNGRFGPYLKRGDETRSLDSEEQLFTVTVDEALERFAQPKRGRRASAAVLDELGEDPRTGSKVVVKSGRYGPYVTDGETNASLPRDLAPEDVTLERASEMLEERRKNPPKKPGGKKSATSAKKASAKRASGKKASAKKKTTRSKPTSAKSPSEK
jgi:DNA topoisomerase-1